MRSHVVQMSVVSVCVQGGYTGTWDIGTDLQELSCRELYGLVRCSWMGTHQCSTSAPRQMQEQMQRCESSRMVVPEGLELVWKKSATWCETLRGWTCQHAIKLETLPSFRSDREQELRREDTACEALPDTLLVWCLTVFNRNTWPLSSALWEQ